MLGAYRQKIQKKIQKRKDTEKLKVQRIRSVIPIMKRMHCEHTKTLRKTEEAAVLCRTQSGIFVLDFGICRYFGIYVDAWAELEFVYAIEIVICAEIDSSMELNHAK